MTFRKAIRNPLNVDKGQSHLRPARSLPENCLSFGLAVTAAERLHYGGTRLASILAQHLSQMPGRCLGTMRLRITYVAIIDLASVGETV